MTKVAVVACVLISLTTQAQNVGIGTTTPNAPLHIRSTTSSELLRLEGGTDHYLSFYSGATFGGYLWQRTSFNRFELGTVAPHDISISPGGSTFAYFTTTRRLGIGTSTPQTALDVITTSLSTPASFNGIAPMYIPLYENGTYRGYLGSYSGSAEDMDIGTGGGTTGKLHLTIQATPKLSITNAGDVGIGTTSPLFRLDVRNGSINTDSVYRIGTIQVLSTKGFGNLFVGESAGNSNTSGASNTFSGDQAGFTNSAGVSNSYFGERSGYSNTGGGANSFFGSGSGYFNTTSYNSLFGFDCGHNNTTGDQNSFFGAEAGYSNNVGWENSFFGRGSGYENETGKSNSFFGHVAGAVNFSGSNNSFFGAQSASLNESGHDNSFFGYRAGNANSIGSFNTAIGVSANFSMSSFTNATSIGYNAVVNANNKIRLGNSSVTVVEGAAVYTVSDNRFKSDINKLVPGLDFIMALNPVTYHFDARKFDQFLAQNKNEKGKGLDNLDYSYAEQRIHNGFIAQEVEQLVRSKGYRFGAVHVPTNPTDNYSIAYAEFVVPLVKAMQEQQAIIQTQQKQIDELRRMVEEVRQQGVRK